jgi:hypothetical protein
VILLIICNVVAILQVVAAVRWPRKYSDSPKDNFDIYLPNWLARYSKLIYSFIVGVTLTILFFRLILN